MITKNVHLILFITAFTLIPIFISCDTDSDYDRWRLNQLTDFGRMPRWSPDGNYILFGGDTTDKSGLYLWEWGTTPRLLADSLPPHNWDYHWSPDGEKAAFTSPGEWNAEVAGVWIVDFVSGEKARLLDRGNDLSWYYDGLSVLVRLDQPETGAPGIYRIYLNHENMDFVADGFHPVCSTDTSWIAFNESEINGRLYLSNVDNEQVAISGLGAVQWVWSADGKTLCCVVNDYVSGIIHGSLYRIRYKDSQWETELIVSESTGYPAPSRSGSEVAYLKMSENAGWEGLYLYSDKNSDDVHVADYVSNPEFDPLDNNRIAVDITGSGIWIAVKD